MKFKVYSFGLLLTIFLISCSDTKKEPEAKIPEFDNKEASQQKKSVTTLIDSTGMINKLQGKWKESEYPFRAAHFINTTVKFNEEGAEREPTFREFKISKNCPFEVNNIKNAQSEDVFLVIIEAKSCEILKVSNTTLTLSGFNISNGQDYKLVYSKME
jgi:PBP1b-binding outer membrane lipoprotein LpoB